MSFERIDHEKHSVVWLTEPRLDLNAMKSLNEHFVECKKQYINRIIIDLSKCETISSEGIGLLVSMWEFFQHDGKMFIVIKQESVINLLKECGLYTALQDCFYDDIETARVDIQRWPQSGFYKTGSSSRACPVCCSNNIGFYDNGFKRLKRLLQGKKRRRVCKDCYLVWRSKK